MVPGRRFVIGMLVALTVLAGAWPSEAADPGYELAKACRANLNKLREATESCIKSGAKEFPSWAKLDDIRTMILTSRFLPERPKPPTPDCEYFLVFKNPGNFDWYCNLHGLIGGDSPITFRYHEFQFTAYTSSRYLNIPKYKTHTENLLRWASYEPTLLENFKYHYARNPMTTMGIGVLALLFVYFIWRSVFD